MRRQEDLFTSPELQREILDNLPFGIQIFDRNGTSRMINEKQKELLGLPDLHEGIGSFNVLTDPFSVANGANRIYEKAYRGEKFSHVFKYNFGKAENQWKTRKDTRVFKETIFPVKDTGNAVKYVVALLQDITEKTGYEKKLKESEERYRLLSGLTNEGILIHEKGRMIDLNLSFSRMLGYAPDELTGKDFVDTIVYHEDIPVVNTHIERSIPDIYEIRVVRKDGKVLPVEVQVRNLILHGKTRRVAAFRDLTEHKRRDKELRESEQKFRHVFESSSAGKSITLISGEIYPNRALCEMLGYTREELTRKKWQEITPENDIPRTQKVIDALVSGKKDTARYTKVFIHKDGSPVWVDVSIALIRDEKGDPDYFITTDIDISKRIEAMRSLSASEERYRTFINATEDMAFLKDKGFRYLFINDANAAFFGEKPKDIIGKDDFSLMPEQAALNCRESDQKALRNGSLYTQEENIGDRIYESRKFPVLLQDGTTGVGGIVRDITEKYYTEAQIREQNKELLELNRKLKSSLNHVYQTTRELKLAKEKAEESDRLKSAFLANMSHEIRTPMNGILGFVDLLQKAGLNEKQERLYLDMVEKSGKRLLNTINDIIEISKIEADEVRLQFAPVDVDDMVRYLYEFFRPQAEAKGLYLRVKKDPEQLPFHLLSDRYKLEAVLMNFMRNAIKFTEKGGVAFGYAFSGGELDLWVKDSGIGISRERLDAVFERFVQADLTKSSPYEGSGLGLSIAKAYADMLGSRLHVGSEPGKGSTFGIALTVNNKNTIKRNGDDDEQGNNKAKP